MTPPAPPERDLPIWIDTDIALGSPAGDVDDAFALAAILSDRRSSLLGVSSVFGNTDSSSAAENARELLALAPTVRAAVVSGARRPGERTQAAEAIASLPEGTHVLALGPLTNIAQALAIRPGLLDRLGSVSFVGGNLTSRGRWPPYWPHEFNLARDVAAARAFLSASGRRRMYPLDVLGRFRVGPAELARLEDCGPIGARLAEGSSRWMRRTRLRMRRSFAVWDLVPALDLLGAAGFERETRRLAIAAGGGIAPSPTAPPLLVVTALEPDSLHRFFFSLLEGRGDSLPDCLA